MKQSGNRGQFAVLYVDDEEKALKYFRMAYGGDFPVLTASNVADAVEILRRQADQIGILITDQRMPGEQGVDLLKRVCSEWPGIVRILTTAYSDLDDAIDAVNSGEILRYVTKPWDIQALRAELRHAMDFFLLRRERDLLLDDKFSVRQRMVLSDRLRDLMVIVAGLGRLRHACYALSAYVRDALRGGTDRPAGVSELELWGLTIDETRSLMAVNSNLQALDRSVADGFEQRLDIAEPLHSAGMTVTGSAPKLAVDAALAQRLCSSLARIVGTPATADLTAAALDKGGPGAQIVVTGSRSAVEVFGRGGLEHVDHGDLPVAYLIAWHHGGSLSVEAESGDIRLQLQLPADPATVNLPEPGEEWLGEQFALLEDWD